MLGHTGSLGRVEPEFFFLGMALLLLEAKSVVQFELLFGATWLVNSLVFFSILVMVLIANLIVRFVRFDRPLAVYGLLLATLVLQFVFPLDQLLGFGAVPRFALAGLLTFGPVLVANILFSPAFRDTAHPDRAFAWNLIGSMVDGTLEYTSLLLGYAKRRTGE